MANLLFELGSEELPGAFIDPALAWLEEELRKQLKDVRLGVASIEAEGTPRRLTLIARGIDDKQPDQELEVTGPKAEAAFAADGSLTPAGQGFLRGKGITPDAAYRKKTPKGEVLAAKVFEKGQSAAQVLPAILSNLIAKIPFKKRMRWGDEKSTYARPLQWILALLDGQKLDISYAHVVSSTTTRGHRFHAPQPVDLVNTSAGTIDAYLAALSAGGVTLNRAARKQKIVQDANALAASVGGELVHDEDLLDLVKNLVETPYPLLGKFDESFLDVPKELLISEMREHQKYFSIVDKNGKLLPYFIVVSGSKPSDASGIAGGNARVLRARFEDGAFYYREDKKQRLEERMPKLAQLVFHRELGTVADKVHRIEKLVQFLAKANHVAAAVEGHAVRAAQLCKADLVSGVVGEFTDLQGIMGRYYALLDGEAPEVAAAIEEHYVPRRAGEALPAGEAGALVGLADRLDTIAGILAIGKGPTGSTDPFSLRRQAIAVLHILAARNYTASLSALAKAAADGYAGKVKMDAAQLHTAVLDLLKGRLSGVLAERSRSEGIEGAEDVVEATIGAGFDDVPDVAARTAAMAKMRSQDAAAFAALAATFKRAGNIVVKARQDAAATGQKAEYSVNADLMQHPSEVALLQAVRAAKASDVAGYAAQLTQIASLKPFVDKFFDDVMVMVEDKALQHSRLGLMGEVESMLIRVADFTRIQIEK